MNFMANTEPCSFPALNDGVKASSARGVINVPLPRDLPAFCNERSLSLSQIIRAMWALVLRCYIRNDLVSFGYLQLDGCRGKARKGRIGRHKIQATEDRLQSGMVAFQIQIHINNADFISKVVQSAKGVSMPDPSHHVGAHPFNTIMVYKQANVHIPGSVKQLLNEFDIIVITEYRKDNLSVAIQYLTSRLSDRAAVNVAHTCHKTLSSLLAQFDQRVEDLVTLSERDETQIFNWNQAVPESVDDCVHHVIQRQALARPNSQAICSWDGVLTYHELDRLSSKLAHHLCRLGVQPESVVPFCFEKSMWAVVTIMAVFKSGGAVLPLDPSHPRSRSEPIIRGASGRFIVASPLHAHLFEGIVEEVVVVSSSFLNSLEEVDCSQYISTVSSQNAAFVLFTSGSSGRPKGIVQDHAAVCTMSRAYAEVLNVNADSRVLQFAAYVFDVSTVDIVNTLMHGGSVCIPSEYDRTNNIVEVINSMQVNWANLTPSFASLLKPEDVPTLQTLVLAGEEVKQNHVSRWADKVRLINCYGPAESGGCITHVYSSSYSHADTIGYAIPCARCWIVDVNHPDRLASIGVIGELVVEGPTLARGYFNDRERTSMAFIERPQWLPKDGSVSLHRFYKTGDLVYYRTDGSLAFAGRQDTQVKIRGQRVELGEAEHCLSKSPAIAKCLIAFPKFGQHAERLVAVVQLQGLASQPNGNDCLCMVSEAKVCKMGFNVGEASDCMKKEVPAYMVPTAWVVVENIPLTTSKKMDRKRVEKWLESCQQFVTLDPASQSRLSHDSDVALKISSKAANIVACGNSQISAALEGHDFTLSSVGIDSLQVITLSRWITQEFGTKIRVEQLTCNHVSIRSLAKIIAESRESPFKEIELMPVDLLSEVEALCAELLSSSYASVRGFHADQWKSGKVFVTGATGFLGTQILRQLLAKPIVTKIVVHVRSSSAQHGLQRVIDAARASGWWLDCFTPKLEVWPGDLSEPRLGLTEQQWKCLTGDTSSQDKIHAIVHNGVAARWNASYETLRSANVRSTLELLGAVLASTSSTRFTYVSGGQRLTFEDKEDRLSASQVISSTGYAQTKLVSELVVKRFASSEIFHHHHLSIIKPSYIIGTAEEGIANIGDYLWRFVASAIEISAYNRDEADSWLFLSDVERVANAVVQSTCNGNPQQSNIIKILDGLPLHDFWDIVIDNSGCDLQPVNCEDWWSMLRKSVEAKGDQHRLWPFLDMLESGKGNIGSVAVPKTEVPEATRARVRTVVKRNVQYLVNIGFLQKPNKKRKLATEEEF